MLDPQGAGWLTWLPADAGGRASGPPQTTSYRPTAAFVDPNSNQESDHHSLWLEFDTPDMEVGQRYPFRFAFFRPENVAALLAPGAVMHVKEGFSRTVAIAEITELYDMPR